LPLPRSFFGSKGDAAEFSHERLRIGPLREAREILVERVGFLRWAERDGRFDQAVEMLSAH
jgi:short-subunit dehydrogenase involved in D-alanine esterification of teichoic acids